MSSMDTRQRAHVLATSACFVVPDVFRSAEYYRDVLGFTFDTFFGNPPSFVIVRRDDIAVMLKQLSGAKAQSAEIGPPEFLDAYFWVNDLGALAEELRQRGADFVVEPTERPTYEGRDFYIRDCDGRILCFGQLIQE